MALDETHILRFDNDGAHLFSVVIPLYSFIHVDEKYQQEVLAEIDRKFNCGLNLGVPT
uniref:Uncharacterized protein n=1 Tax=Marseillevirus LCMAC103 TaxID=2506604 RepID=A0A481YU37_9VIRU|nr:MAG: hypothetical protein LCMAC103_00010 [Marseillevirus LCMAC103]